LQTDLAGLLLRAILRAQPDMRHRQWPGEVLGPPGRDFRDGGGQLPLAEHAGIAEYLERLRAGRRRDSAQHNSQTECPHGPLPCPGQCVFRNARASATAVRALSASPAIVTICSEYSRALALSPDFLAASAAPT